MTTDPNASLWDVTRLILDSPGVSPASIAQSHGFDLAEIAELLPLVVDNLRFDFAHTVAPSLPPAQPAPGESAADFVGRYLSTLAETGGVDLMAHDTLGPSVPQPAPTANGSDSDVIFGAGRADGTAPDPTSQVPDEQPTRPVEEADDGVPLVDGGDPLTAEGAVEETTHLAVPDEPSESDFQFD